MKRLIVQLTFLLGLLGLMGCSAPKETLSDADVALINETGISQAYLLQVKSAGRNLRQLESFGEDGEPTKAAGVTIDVPNKESFDTARKLQDSSPPGWMAFVSEEQFGIGGAPDHVSVVKASSIGEVLLLMGTSGPSYDISPEMVVERLQEWDKRYGLKLQGAGADWLEASFTKQPTDMLAFAEEVYEFCPDVVDQGTGTVEALADEMKRMNRVYLWWD